MRVKKLPTSEFIIRAIEELLKSYNVFKKKGELTVVYKPSIDFSNESLGLKWTTKKGEIYGDYYININDDELAFKIMLALDGGEKRLPYLRILPECLIDPTIYD